MTTPGAPTPDAASVTDPGAGATTTTAPAPSVPKHRWRDDLVRPAGGGDRRRPTAVIQLVGGLLLAAALNTVITWLPTSDRGLASWLVDLGLSQSWVGTTARVLLLGVVPVAVIVIALLTQSWRLLISAAAAIAASLVVSGAVHPFVDPVADREQALAALSISTHFPLPGVAVPIALLTVASSFLAKPARRLLGWLVAIGLVAFVVAVDAFPLDVLASVLVGWAVAGLVGLVFETPVGDATPDEVAGDLTQLGVLATSVDALSHPLWGTARYRAETDGGTVLVDVHGREAEDARAMQRTWRSLTVKQGVARVAVGRREQAEHESLLLSLASQRGVPVPQLVATGAVGSADNGYVVVSDGGARPFGEVDGDAVDDELLASVWSAVSAAHDAGLTHNLLDASSIEVRPDNSAQLTDWFVASSVAGDQTRDADVATLMLVTAVKVGADRSVAAAVAHVGTDGVTRALPMCQLGILDRRARADVDKNLAADVRTAAAKAVGIDPPELAELRRVSMSQLLMLGGTFLGFWLLYNQLASLDNLWETLGAASWPWAVAVFVVAQFSIVFTAVGLRASVTQPLALGRIVALEYADLFTGLVGGTVAITATNIRYFQREGLNATTAVTSSVVSSAAGGIVQVLIIVVGLPFLISSGKLDLDSLGGGGGGGSILIIGILVIALVSGVAMLLPRFRKAVVAKVKPKLEQAKHELGTLLKRPRNLVSMLGGAALAQLALAIALGCALRSFGYSLGIVDLLLINTFASLIGGIAPSPGGMGAVEAGLIAGFTAFGVDATTAGAATFVYRLFTAYLPPAWGYPTLQWMRHRELL